MTLDVLDRLGVLVVEAAGAVAFSASLTTAVSDLQLEVRGVGPIDLPVSQEQARQLCLLGREARYGRGEQTVVDRLVRDTWEVPKSRVKIDKRRWNETLLPVLDRLRRDLGIASGRRLTAELHSMLVYAPGQFFVQHQDSEKDDAMVASLVVSLPSTFSGGALEVQHAGATARYRGSKKSLSFVAFYSDCRHEVKPVKSGYRVALTYNLILRDDPGQPASDVDSELTAEVGSCLSEHFDTSGADRLVYLLDHEYTRRGLDWSRLKGVDGRRSAVLAAAAERAGCSVTLALADVHETWTAYDRDEYRRSGYRHWDEGNDDVGSPSGSDEYVLDDLIESSITLESWLEPGRGRVETVGIAISDDEVCASTPTGELQPHQSEYEGYMGNWGNTLDRWYHRGAVLVWPRSREFALRAQASPAWALSELTARARRGDVTGAREAARDLDPFWGRAAAAVEARGFFGKAMRTARAVDDPAVAALLLAPFHLERLAASHATALSALVEAYGDQWACELVVGWSARWRSHHHQPGSPETWIAASGQLLLALRGTGDAGAAFAAAVVRESWKRLSRSVDQARALTSPSGRDQGLSDLGHPIAAIMEGATLVGARDVSDDIVGVLCGDGDVSGCAITVLKVTAPERWDAVGLDGVAVECSAVLQARLAAPARRSDDWSIELPHGCACELCAELRAFLETPTQSRMEWPLAKNRRSHVHARIDVAEIAVRHQTRRVGRPYTLVLTKTDELFDRDAQRRRRDEQDLAWLRRGRRS